MKKIEKIVIPVGKIASIATVFTGMATSILVDESLKKSTTGNKYVDELGRNGAGILIGTAFSVAAAEVWNDKSMDIVIPLKKSKSEGPRKKDFKRFNRATELWTSLMEAAMNSVSWVDEHPEEDIENAPAIDGKMVDEFNRKMVKLANRIGFDYEPINVFVGSSVFTARQIIDECRIIGDRIKKAYEYLYGTPAPVAQIGMDDFVDNDDFDYDEEDIDSADENVIPEEANADLSDALIESLSNFDIDIDRIDKQKVGEIFSLYSSGMISATQACERIIEIAAEEVVPETYGEESNIPEKIEKPEPADDAKEIVKKPKHRKEIAEEPSEI